MLDSQNGGWRMWGYPVPPRGIGLGTWPPGRPSQPLPLLFGPVLNLGVPGGGRALRGTSRQSRGAELERSLSCRCLFLLGLRQGEKRADIQLNSFGFYTNGSLEVDLSLLRLGLQETEEKAPLVRGFEEFAGAGRRAQVSKPPVLSF